MKIVAILITVGYSLLLNAQSVITLQGHKQSFESIDKHINNIIDSANIAGLSVIIIIKTKLFIIKLSAIKTKQLNYL